MTEVQKKVRQRQAVEELCGAAVRALTGDADLHIRAGGLYQGRRRQHLHAPHLRMDQDTDDLVAYRGVIDGIAMRRQLTDEAVHQEHCPKEPVQRLIFELLEQLRVESLVPGQYPGAARNLVNRFTQWSESFHQSGVADTALGILVYTLAQICWSRLNNRAVLEATEDFIEATRAGIVPILGHELAALKRHREDQKAFAETSVILARKVDEMMLAEQQARGIDDEEQEDEEENTSAFKLLLDFDETECEGMASVTTGSSKVFDEAEAGYQIFSTEFDRELDAGSLVRPALLRELREKLDERVRGQGVNTARLIRQLAVLFAHPERDDWLFGEEEGYIDGSRLTQLLSSPSERRLFKTERYESKPKSAVSFLIDCSGSMKEHIESIAVLIDIFGRALERVGVTVEVLGFTTGAWNGGKVQRRWMSKGRPAHPGRLNELCYMVYKNADTNWRRARPAISAMLKPDLFREGIDGEAVDWACARLNGQDEDRKVLIVLSDGCPMDGATNLANDQFYLDNHLKEVVGRHEELRDVEIYGLGVGLDLSPYYSQSLALDLTDGLSNELFDDILQLLSGRHRR